MNLEKHSCIVCTRPTSSYISVCQNCREFFVRSYPQMGKWKCVSNGDVCEFFSASPHYCRYCRLQKCLISNIPIPNRIMKRGSYCVPFFEKTDINRRIEEISLALYPRGIQLLKRINGCKTSIEFANRMAEFDKMISNLDGPSPSELDACLDVSLGDVLYNPECCSTRKTAGWDLWQPSELKTDIQYRMKNTYARLISFYADFAFGIPEMQQLHISDKLKLAQQNFMSFATLSKLHHAWKQGIGLDTTLNRTKRYASTTESAGMLRNWYKNTISSMHQCHMATARHIFDELVISDQEVALLKIICLFATRSSNIDPETVISASDLSYEGVRIAAVARDRYSVILSNYISLIQPDCNENQIFVRLSKLLRVATDIKAVADPASRLFEMMVSKNIGELQGTLTHDLHLRKY